MGSCHNLIKMPSTVIDMRGRRKRHSAVRNYIKELKNAPWRKELQKTRALSMGAKQGYTKINGIPVRLPNPYTLVNQNTGRMMFTRPQIRLGTNPAFLKLAAKGRGMLQRRKFNIQSRLFNMKRNTALAYLMKTGRNAKYSSKR